MLDQREMSKKMKSEAKIFDDRLESRIDELKWLYIELYHNDWMFADRLMSCRLEQLLKAPVPRYVTASVMGKC